MRKLLYMSTLLCTINLVPSAEPQTTEQILRKMVGNAIDAALDHYHKDDWRQIRDSASHFWRDPSSPLEQEVNSRVNKFHKFLLSTLLHDKKAALVILSQYFDYQLDCLQIDYADAPKSRLHVWSNTPPQFHATLAFEIIAGNFGIKLTKDYHRDYALASERARLVEDQQRRIEAENAKVSIPEPPPIAPPPPASPNMKNTALKCSIPKTEKKDINLIQIRGQIGELKSRPKITKSGTSSLSPDVLGEIKKGSIKLKPVAERILKEKSTNQGADLTDILTRRLEQMRKSIKGN